MISSEVNGMGGKLGIARIDVGEIILQEEGDQDDDFVEAWFDNRSVRWVVPDVTVGEYKRHHVTGRTTSGS